MKALLVIDMLKDFIDEKGALSVGPAGKKIIPFIKETIEKFRQEGYPIIFICDNHEKDDKEFDMFPPHCITQTRGAEIIEDINVNLEDKIIRKRRYSAFFGTDLDLYLREKAVDELYLAGVCTNICVLYTVEEFCNRDLTVRVYRDGVMSFDTAAHEFALQQMENVLGAEILAD